MYAILCSITRKTKLGEDFKMAYSDFSNVAIDENFNDIITSQNSMNKTLEYSELITDTTTKINDDHNGLVGNGNIRDFNNNNTSIENGNRVGAVERAMEDEDCRKLTDFPEIDIDAYPPWNFGWIIPNKLAGMALPRNVEHMNFLTNEGIAHLVTLCAEKKPPVSVCPQMKWSEIPVEQFEIPTLKQIITFIDLYQKADRSNEAVGVHCRLGRSRCGVVLACCLLRVQHLTPEQAIHIVKTIRPGSIDEPEQEAVVEEYYVHLSKSVTSKQPSEREINAIIDTLNAINKQYKITDSP